MDANGQLLETYVTLRVRERLTPAEVRRHMHVHFREAAAFEYQLQKQVTRAISNGGAGIFVPTDKQGDPEQEPLHYDDYSNEALEALEDFAVFRTRYFGHTATPWQQLAAVKMLELLETPVKEYVVCNEPPGSGKSTLFAHDLICWMLCKNRALRVMIGSYTERQAVQYAGRIRRSLSRKHPVPGAESTLIQDFGGFRPLQRDLWRTNEFIIAQQGEVDYSQKEPSVGAYGYDSAFLGGRFDLAIWDDLVDSHVLRSTAAMEAMEKWFGDEAETRVEPGGLFILQGQRMGPNDLYRFALDLKLEDNEPRYHHIVFKAHYDDLCKQEHGQDAPYWPDGCLLDPVRVPWRELAAKQKNAFTRYQTLFQQEDRDDSSSLAKEVWINGGNDDGEYYPGCWDKTRRVGDLPPDWERMVPVITVDPSATNMWGLIYWLIDPATEYRYLLDIYNAPMQISEFLDFSHNTGDFSGILERWYQHYSLPGLRLQYVIVESNAAQRWLFQSRIAQQWSTNRGVTFVPHQTSTKKNDPEFGIQSLRPVIQFGKLRLPGKGHNDHVAEFVKQLLQWPLGRFDDLVLSAYFLESKWEVVSLSKRGASTLWTPQWMRGTQRGLAHR